MPRKRETLKLQRRLVLSSAIGILFMGLLVASISIWPLYKHLLEYEQQRLYHTISSQTKEIEHFLSRYKEVAMQVASRTQIRNYLDRYNKGEVPLQALVDFTADKLEDAIVHSEGLIGISRLDEKGNIVVQVGKSIPSENWIVPSAKAKHAVVGEPFWSYDRYYIVISAPIIENPHGQRIGTDLLLFDATFLEQIVDNSTALGDSTYIIVGTVKQDVPKSFFPLPSDSSSIPDNISLAMKKASAGEKGTTGITFGQNDPVVAYYPILESDWVAIILMKPQELQVPIQQQLTWTGLTIMALITLGVLVMIALLRPLTGKMLIHTQEMELEVQAKTQALQAELENRQVIEIQLLKAKETAEQANRAKSQFLANISHEIRTPLHGINGMTELLLERPLGEEERNIVTIISDSGHNLLTIVNDLLDFSKIEAGKMTLEKSLFCLADLIERTTALVALKAQKKDLKIICQVSPDIPSRLQGDANRIQQILLNFLSNAIKFTEQGKVSLTVTKLSTNPLWLRFEVEDTGIGISEDMKEKLFQPFSQVDDSSTRKYDGTGLGLSISKGLVELMSGQIGVDSTFGQGSLFWFTIPLEMVEEKGVEEMNRRGILEDLIENSGEVAVTTPSDRLTNEAVPLLLLAEDNPVNQKLALMQLKKLGYQAYVVNNGEEAIEAVQKANYSLVLMDCQMPVMDGFEATRAIRNLDKPCKDIPIIAMTAHAIEGYRQQCLESGMNDYFTKPVKMGDLDRILKKWL
ncbi:response regulator [Heliorestis acidaminivorans]|uniref:Circadian input-output histidine kinase CikA n=1 Tax=Heliorestis acidaminivorans TaxID=553427 RepID=A0A6I0F6P0_9FIRM|nr:hybrid sensor histidine kinase/response regulator [Heliorestis acidaminivorans]KAB2954642.1 response regulator [Heliorestis acidaminivorans]